MLDASASARTWRWPAFAAIIGLLWLFAARSLGPGDLWDQTQPKTISYTTDIIAHGGSHWLLPVERGVMPATKPPLYNWLAVPFVKALGFHIEVAHKFPSVIALCLCWLIIVRLGRWLDRDGDQSVGWLAGLILVSNATIFKLGYLARPDMVLTLWLLLAWMIATHLYVQHARRVENFSEPIRGQGWLAAAFWICIALAGMTKGPAAVVGVVYAIVAARIIGGSWRAMGLLHPWIGLPIVLLVNGAWVYAVWQINPHHLKDRLWGKELLGRVTGDGPEGNPNHGWLKTLPYLVLYFLVRFIPWSLAAIAAIVGLWQKSHPGERALRTWRSIGGETGPWLCAAAIQVVLVIGLFSLSTGKRADYIASAFPPGALLAAWWLLRMKPHLGLKAPWLAPAIAAVALTAMTIVNGMEIAAPVDRYNVRLQQFIDQSAQAISDDPLPVAFWWTGQTHLQAMLGASEMEGRDSVMRLLALNQPFWVVAGRRDQTLDFADWLPRQTRKRLDIELVARSEEMPWRTPTPEPMSLYRVSPKAAVANTPAAPATQPRAH